MSEQNGMRITRSESIKALAAALSKAQGEFPSVKKTKTAKVGTYSYHYADLADVLAAVVPILSKHEFALVQLPQWDRDKLALELETSLLHSSGEWLCGYYPLPTAGKPQEMGSAITYARRYSVQSLLGISAEEDDDGAAAQNAEEKPRRVHADARPVRPVEAKPSDVVSKEQADDVRKLIAESGVTKADAIAEISRVCGVKVNGAGEIPSAKFAAVVEALSRAKAVPA